MKKNPRGTRVFKTPVLPRVLLTQHSSSCRSEDQIIQSPTQCSIVQLKLQRSSFFLCSLFLFKFVLPLFFIRSFFLFSFRSVFNHPIGAPTFFILRSSFVHCSSSDLFFISVLHQIVLPILLHVYCSSSTKIESQRLSFAF